MRPFSRSLVLTTSALALSLTAMACGPAAAPPPANTGAPIIEAPVVAAPAPVSGGVTQASTVPGPGGQGTPKKGGVWHGAQNDDPPTFDVHATSFGLLTRHSDLTHSRITRYDYNGKPGSLVVVSDLAEKWEVSADAKVWTFTLRKGVKFQNLPPVNGREVTADDIKFSIDRINGGNTSVWKGMWDIVDKMEVVDKYTFKFTLKTAYASFLNRTSQGDCCWIVAKEVVSMPDYGKDPNKSMIGTGPFMFDKYERGVLLSEKRNPDYFGLEWKGEIPYLDGVERLIIKDRAAALAAFVTKQIDTNSIAVDELAKVKAAIPGVQLRQGAGNASSNGMNLNTSKPPFDNLKVRQALQLAVSQDNVIKGLFQGEGKWHGFMGSDGTAWALPTDEVKKLYRYDPEAAKKLLAEAGYPNGGVKAELMYSNSRPPYPDISEVWKNDAAKAGFDITLKPESDAVARKNTEDGAFTLYIGPHVTAIEPDYVVKEGIVPGGTRNFSKLNDPIINDLSAKQAVIVNYEARKKITDDIQRRVAEVVPMIPTPAQITYSGAQPYLKNWFPGAGLDDCDEQFWWIDGK